MKKSSPESGRCPQVEIRYDKYPPSAGARPPGEIRCEKKAPSVGHRPPAEICHGNCCFSTVKEYIMCCSSFTYEISIGSVTVRCA